VSAGIAALAIAGLDTAGNSEGGSFFLLAPPVAQAISDALIEAHEQTPAPGLWSNETLQWTPGRMVGSWDFKLAGAAPAVDGQR